MGAGPVRVLIVDDSISVRAILQRVLNHHPQIEVVGMARDGIEAISRIKSLRPDVVTLDVEMPRLSGLGVLERVAGRVPVSFVMVSSLTEAGGRVTVDALRLGAFDYVTKPSAGEVSNLPEFRSRITRLVLAADKAKGRYKRLATKRGSSAPTLPPCKERGWLVAIGISCGGPQTLHQMLPCFPSDFPSMVVTLHMPSPFTSAFASGLDRDCPMKVVEVTEPTRVQGGTIYIAQGGTHLKVKRRGIEKFVQPDRGPKVGGHRPSVDFMFDSVAKVCGPRSIGVVMTGMGDDGAVGITRLHQAGAWTLAQDKDSSVVYGMPQAAAATGSVDHVLPLSRIPIAILRLMGKGVRRTKPVTA